MFVSAKAVVDICSVLTPLLALTAGVVGLVKGENWDKERRRPTKKGSVVLTVSILTATTSLIALRASRIVSQDQEHTSTEEKDEMKRRADATITAITTEKDALQKSLDSSFAKQIIQEQQVISAQAESLQLSRQLQLNQLAIKTIHVSWYPTARRQSEFRKEIRALLNRTVTSGRYPTLVYDRAFNSLNLRWTDHDDSLISDVNDVDVDSDSISKWLQSILPRVSITSDNSGERVELLPQSVVRYSISLGMEEFEVHPESVNATFATAPIKLWFETDDIPNGRVEIEMLGSNLQAKGLALWPSKSLDPSESFLIQEESQPVKLDVHFLGQSDSNRHVKGQSR